MKKTSNKGFSMVELIIVIAIMAILAAALAPSLIKYINKSRLSTAVSDGTTIASSINSALASEAAFQAADSYTAITPLNTVLATGAGSGGDAFANEVFENVGKSVVTGKAKKDLNGSSMTTAYYIKIDTVNNTVEVYYGDPNGSSNFQISPNVGTSLSN